jgi:NADPH:quinone reductase-like Zn-dependent oxidoreductase
MRAAVLSERGGAPSPGTWEDPVARDGLEVVAVERAGLNPIDRSLAGRERGPEGPLPIPRIPGREGVGRLGDGRRVYFDGTAPPFGSMAERSLADPAKTYPVPEELDAGLAVAIGIAGLAAWLALDERAKLRPGEHVLVLGASGAVGQLAIQAARLLGAERVVAAARHTAPAEALGPDAVVTLGAGDDATALADAGGSHGFDVIVDPLWSAPLVAALGAAAPRARVAALGQSAGPEIALPLGLIMPQGIAILGQGGPLIARETKAAAYARMTEHVLAGDLTVPVETVVLEDIADAWTRQGSGPHVKLVLDPT